MARTRTQKEKEERKEKDKKITEEYQKYFSENPDKLNNCVICGDTKKLSLFVSNYFFRNKCKNCHKKKVYKWRSDEPDLAKAARNRSFRKSADFLKSLKEGKQCEKCKGKFHPCQLDFHHLTEKSINISQLYQKRKDRAIQEASKCSLLCANCHRDETYLKSAEHYKKYQSKPVAEIIEIPMQPGCEKKECVKCKSEKHINNFTLLKIGKRHSYCKRCMRIVNREASEKRQPGKTESGKAIEELKSKTPCSDCKKQFGYWVMDLDHVSGDKIDNLNKLQSKSLEKVLEEISKCEIICACCHRLRTFLNNKKEGSQEEIEENQEILDNIIVSRIYGTNAGKDFLNQFHYDKFGRPATAVYTASYNGEDIGIIKFSPIIRKEVATSMGLIDSEVLELDRACLDTRFRIKNLMSKIISTSVRLLKRDFPEISHLVSFADTAQGHTGSIYRASNWQYAGSTGYSHKYVDKSGLEIKKKTVYNRAIALGMKEREYAEANKLKKERIPEKLKFILKLRNK